MRDKTVRTFPELLHTDETFNCGIVNPLQTPFYNTLPPALQELWDRAYQIIALHEYPDGVTYYPNSNKLIHLVDTYGLIDAMSMVAQDLQWCVSNISFVDDAGCFREAYTVWEYWKRYCQMFEG